MLFFMLFLLFCRKLVTKEDTILFLKKEYHTEGRNSIRRRLTPSFLGGKTRRDVQKNKLSCWAFVRQELSACGTAKQTQIPKILQCHEKGSAEPSGQPCRQNILFGTQGDPEAGCPIDKAKKTRLRSEVSLFLHVSPVPGQGSGKGFLSGPIGCPLLQEQVRAGERC